ncbi:hypothetical protein CDD82_1112 [Ophiocordyceps australis]|uniref:CMP/dCMP-type deaminase domain-containing protein n=1 Tax=Ophiocordyceps australis TaxID=1399860 RepID=A0A2C5YGD4_9HYPO|nr:hypothetical protein CDD82_1112 [Ophiocordyceps australis]
MKSSSSLVFALLAAIEDSILPITRKAVLEGNPVFGAAVISRNDLSVVTAANNNATISPLLHGEVNCMERFFTETFPDAATRPQPGRDVIFLATHEPCSLCLSALAWSGFSEFYYLFTYEENRRVFGFTDKDVSIIRDLFHGGDETTSDEDMYSRRNAYFTGRALADVVDGIEGGDKREKARREMERIKGLYGPVHEEWKRVTGQK